MWVSICTLAPGSVNSGRDQGLWKKIGLNTPLSTAVLMVILPKMTTKDKAHSQIHIYLKSTSLWQYFLITGHMLRHEQYIYS